MDGAKVMSFTLREVPRLYRNLLEASGVSEEDVDHVVLHQANRFMLDALQHKMAIAEDKAPRYFEDVGNTVSSTIPFVLAKCWTMGKWRPEPESCLMGFGVGLSWAAATIQT
jgi:3-oxoacyl-[acyl-carrier-protein] synthase-3